MHFQALKTHNEQYEAKFGHIFIVCASGKSASEMLDLVQDRYDKLSKQHCTVPFGWQLSCQAGNLATQTCHYRIGNSPHAELLNAAKEQMKITEIRLQKLVSAQEAPTASSPESSTVAERRAGLVLNHLLGAPLVLSSLHTLCCVSFKIQNKARLIH